MKIAVVGATGGTGRQVVEQALAAGHQVTALARTPGKLAIEHNNLTVIQGDVLDSAAVREAVAGADAVVVSLGSTPDNPDMICTNGTRNVIAAMNEAASGRRLLVVSSLGVGDSKDQAPFAFRMLMKTVLKKAMEDKEAQELLVKASGLDWTIVRPGGLTDGPRTGGYVYGVDRGIKAGQVSRADVAGFLLEQLASDEFLGKAPAIT